MKNAERTAEEEELLAQVLSVVAAYDLLERAQDSSPEYREQRLVCLLDQVGSLRERWDDRAAAEARRAGEVVLRDHERFMARMRRIATDEECARAAAGILEPL